MKRILLIFATFFFASPALACEVLERTGEPHLRQNGSIERMCNIGYHVTYDTACRIPRIVVQRFWEGYRFGFETRRDDRFRVDPRVQNSPSPRDYTGSGFDRGHMAPAADFSDDGVAQAQTFYMTNVAPQNRYLNRRLWARVEHRVRQIVQQRPSEYVVMTLAISGVREPVRIGPNRDICVPDMFAKIVLDLKTKRYGAVIVLNDDPRGLLRPDGASLERLQLITSSVLFPLMELPFRFDRGDFVATRLRQDEVLERLLTGG